MFFPFGEEFPFILKSYTVLDVLLFFLQKLAKACSSSCGNLNQMHHLYWQTYVLYHKL